MDFKSVTTDVKEDGSPAITFEPWTDGHAIGFKVTRHGGFYASRNGEKRWFADNTDAVSYSDGDDDIIRADDAVSYVYLNPSTDTWSDGTLNPDAFVYTGIHGHPASDTPHNFYSIDFNDWSK